MQTERLLKRVYTFSPRLNTLYVQVTDLSGLAPWTIQPVNIPMKLK